MTQPPTQVDFDKSPPMPLNAYEQTVKSVNIGYDLVFQLTKCFLHALNKPDLHMLVIGAGGGAEIERFLPPHPGWKLTGVDPSQQMLAQAQVKATELNLAERVTLVQGTIDQLPETQFDAATCLYVLHFLSEDAQLDLLRNVKVRLQSGAPLYLIWPVSVATTDFDMTNPTLKADFLGAWQYYGESMGMAAEQITGIITRLMEQMSQSQGTSAKRTQELIHEAGFTQVTQFCSLMGITYGWIAR